MTNTKIKVNEVKNLIHKTNHVLSELVEGLKQVPSVPFGQELGGSCNAVEFALQKHRTLSKFQVPNQDMQDALWDACMNDWLAHEEKLSNFDLYKSLSETSPQVRAAIYKARMWIHDVLKKHRFRVRLQDCDLDFTPGSTFIPSKGKTSVRQKLKDLKHWTVTYAALPDALELIWNSNCLRHAALAHLVDEHIITNNSYWVVWSHESAFKSLVADHLLTIVNGARGAAVPKNNETMRFINIEPMFNMLLQRAVALELRRIMKIIGNDLERGQSDHRNMISNLAYATMDLQKASDSNHYAGSEFMAPKSLFSLMCKWRSYTTTLSYKGENKEVECVNYKLSAMGNGFTFEWMSLYLLSVCRQFDDTSRVYGDDIIVAANAAEQVRSCLEVLGWVINPKKTFITGEFRESCGAFYHSDAGYITSYDIHFCESMADVIITCNKLRRVMHYHPLLSTAWSSIIEVVPALLKGPTQSYLHSFYVETNNYARSQRKHKSCSARWKKYEYLLRTAEQLWQKVPVSIVTTFEFKSQRVWSAISDITENCDIGFYLFAGRKTDDVLRGKGKWRQTPVVVFDDGSICRLSYIRKVRSGIINTMNARKPTMLEVRIERFVSEHGSSFPLAA